MRWVVNEVGLLLVCKSCVNPSCGVCLLPMLLTEEGRPARTMDMQGLLTPEKQPPEQDCAVGTWV